MLGKLVSGVGQTNLSIYSAQDSQVLGDNEVIERIPDSESEKEKILRAIDELNKFLKEKNTYVKYSVHEEFGDVMIKIINSDTDEVIMECPPKKILDFVAKMCKMVGVMVDKEA